MRVYQIEAGDAGEIDKGPPSENLCLGLRKELTPELVLARIRCLEEALNESLQTFSWAQRGRTWLPARGGNKGVSPRLLFPSSGPSCCSLEGLTGRRGSQICLVIGWGITI